MFLGYPVDLSYSIFLAWNRLRVPKNLPRRLGNPCGHSYKGYTIVNYDSRVVPDWKTLHITTLGS